MRASRRSAAALLACAALAAPARAEPCGAVVLPAGLGSAAPSSATGLNPIVGSSIANFEVQNVIYRPVLWVGRNADIDWSLSLASAAEPSADGMTWRVTLADRRWSDGARITADDVLYCLELIRSMGDLWPGKGYGDMPGIIARFDVTGPRSFTLTLSHAMSRRGFLLNALSALIPLPRHAWGAADIDEMWRRQTDVSFFQAVSGPYKVVRFEPGRFLTMEPNPFYTGPVQPQVRRIVVSFLQGVDALRALRSGDVDASNLPAALRDAATALTGLRVVEPAQGYDINYIGLNFQNDAVGFFDDVRVRQAMADAIDPAAAVALAFHGQGYDMRGPIAPALARVLGVDAPQPAVGFDPARSRALLDEAGWRTAPDGVRAKDGRRLSFTLLTQTEAPAQALLDQVVQRGFAAVGIEMRIAELSFTQLLATVYGPKSGWQAFHWPLFLGPWPDGGPLFGTGGANNNGGWSDARMDDIGARMQLRDDPEMLREYQDYATEQQPVIFLPNEKLAMLARPGLEGLADFLYPNATWAPEFLRLDDKECDARDRQPS